MPVTERTARLKARCRWKTTGGGEYTEEAVRVGIERLRYLTESYKQTYGEPEVIRRAKGLGNVLNKMTIIIQEEELIVGDHAENPNWIPMYPDLGYFPTLDMVESEYMPEEYQEEARELAEYWRPLGLQNKCEPYFGQKELDIAYSGNVIEPPPFIASYMNIVPPYESALVDGLNKRIEIIEKQIEKAMEELDTYPWVAEEKLPLIDKIDLWKAMIIADKAVITWARRYSRLARILAENFESDPRRKEELLQISDICWRVPAEPCKGFWDSLQAKWFAYVIGQSLERYSSGFSHKEDRLLWPYYKTSVIDKTFQPMSREQAQELVECERLKISERGALRGRIHREYAPGINDLHILTVGGLNERDEDDCNDLTDVILDAAHSIRTPEPSIGFRWHPKCRQETKYRVFKCIAAGLGFPSIKHEEINTTQLEKYFGVPHDEARSWALVLCMSPGITGRKATQKSRSEGGGGSIWTVKCLELALSNGFDYSVSNAQIGPYTGDPTTFKNFEDVFEAFKKQLAAAVFAVSKQKDISRLMEIRYLECPFICSLDDACVERGIGGLALKDRPNPWHNVMFPQDVGDSLVAMKKLIFDEKKYTMEELIKALRANWKGYEEMRRDFLAAPKWGNDDPYVDEIFVRLYNEIYEEFQKHPMYAGSAPLPLGQSVANFAAIAPRVGALPSGRQHGEVLADGGISPYVGMDKKGPTAVLKSVAKVDATRFKGLQLNQRLSHALMNSEKGFELWLAYMNTWYDMNIDHVQFNVVRTEDMRAAQREPEKWEDLIVRMAGYSARFTQMPKLAQDAIIARTVQEIG